MPESTEDKIREHYPTMYMTIVSVVVALVFENLFAAMKERDDLWSFSSALLWVEAGAVVLSGVLFWFHSLLFSASIRQLFSLRDAINPFVVLFVLNILVASISTEFSMFFLFWAFTMATGVVTWGYWERLYEAERGDPSARGSFRTVRLISGGIALAVLGVSAGGWVDLVSPLFATVFGVVVITSILFWVQPAFRRGWQKAAGVSTQA